MASSAPPVALKAAAVAVVLAVLVLPSLGRCPSLGPEPPASAPPAPAPAPAPAPGPGPTILCSDCASHCYSTCSVSARAKCNQYCVAGGCDSCRSQVIQQCTANCSGSCNCNADADDACRKSCSTSIWCQPCLEGFGKQCRDPCNSDCTATCVKN